jgi:lipopolysaccharide transport protein LptA
MRPLYPDSRWRGPMIALAAAATLLGLQLASAAGERREPITVDSREGMSFNASGLTINAPQVRQGSTVLRAAKARATNTEDGFKNSTWKFTGQVHLEFDGAVLDGEAATVVFVDGRLSSADVQSASAPPSRQPKKPVHVELNGAQLDVDTAAVAFAEGRIKTVQAQGSPAIFSHLMKKTGRLANGRANRIHYDAGKSLMRLTEDAWFSYGGNIFDTQLAVYNLEDGTYDIGPFIGTHDPAERVPAPSIPDRATAK